MDDLTFKIQAQRERTNPGEVFFRVLVTSKSARTQLQDTTTTRIGASLAIIKDTGSSFSGSHIADLAIRHKSEKSLEFGFPMPEKSLADPTLCFELSFVSVDILGGRKMPHATGYYAVLQDFVKPVPPEPTEPNPYLPSLVGQIAVLLGGIACLWWVRRQQREKSTPAPARV